MNAGQAALLGLHPEYVLFQEQRAPALNHLLGLSEHPLEETRLVLVQIQLRLHARRVPPDLELPRRAVAVGALVNELRRSPHEIALVRELAEEPVRLSLICPHHVGEVGDVVLLDPVPELLVPE